ncbi:glycosyltransferase family 2 protein [Flavobacterium sp. 7A]|uniref:glycosyltransferase family 2 protein n=1 Tax=Flavobacterium sp. 7A TaxID=2940571 RepID=UPI0022260546|nr:glycosyltransferase family 2 protein [Flavobacterium sp. 7A]MCW2119433.1 glycosyltransferase involved in cell wall biosynthesis [Flavobacterium sp. 7A]
MVISEKINSSFMISIIVPCYNQAQYLPEALQSVLNQTWQHWECIIVNDGSPDQTEEVAKEWIAKDSRFKYLAKENGGLSSARNSGLDMAMGEYIQFLDADDCLHESKFEKSLEFCEQLNLDLIISNYVSFTKDISKTNPPRFNLQESYFNYEKIVFEWDFEFAIPIHCAIFKAKYFKGFRFPIHLKAKEDWIMWISIFKQNPNTGFINKPFALYRDHLSSMTRDRQTMQSNYVNALLYLKIILNDNDFNKLLTLILTNLYSKIEIAESNFLKIKKSKTYQWGSKIRNVGNILKVENWFQSNPQK